MDARLKSAHAKLRELRERTDLSLRPTPLLKQTFTDFDGEEKPLRIRYYQVQGILHLVAMNRFLLGDDTGLGKCVVGDTLVKTDRGLVPIRDLNPGVEEPDSFAALEGVRFQVGVSEVQGRYFYYGGEKPTVRLRTRSGYELEGSQIHPVMVRRDGTDQWVRLRDLREGDFVAVERTDDFSVCEGRPEPALPGPGSGAPHERRHRIPSKMSPDLARFLGYLIGEGWFRRHDFFTLSQHREVNPEVYGDMEELGRVLFDVKMQPAEDGFTIASTQIVRFLRGIGCDPSLAPDKEVPWSVLQASPASMREFLRGFVDSEGSASELGIEVSSSSEKLLRQVQVMLLSFGVVSQRNPKLIEGRDRVYWRLQIQGDDARIFSRRIGLVSSRKTAALRPLLEQDSNPNYDVVPDASAEIEDLRAEVYARAGRHGYKGVGMTERWGSAFYNTLGHVRAGRRNPTYQYLRRFLEIAREVGISELNPAYARVQALVRRKWFYDPVDALEDGWAEVYDVEVDDPRHAFIGNGLVNHNTLMGIASLCYIWAKAPETKAVILTNKSLVQQWAGEFDKFCAPGEINVIVCTGVPAKRRKIYQEFEASTGPTVLVMGYATARRDIRQIQEWSGHVLITDECFQYHTPILLADGTQELIGRLVTRKTPAEVLSWNAETGEIEPRRIVGWYRKPMPGIHGRSPSKRTAAMLKLEFRWGGNLLSTPDHEFYRMDGTKVRARDLGSGDRIVHFDRNIPSPDQMQVLLGGLLGDSSVSHPRKTWAVAFGHGTAQKAYLEFKRDVLMSLGVSEVTETRSGYARSKKIWRFRMKANEEFTRVAQDDCGLLVPYSGPRTDRRYRKRITHEWLNRIGPLGLAIWYADDGSLTQYRRKDGSKGYQVRISTDDFTQSEAGMLAGWLYWVWGIKAEPKIEYRKSGGKRKRRRLPYPHLFLGDEAARSFFELLPGAFPGVQAKFPDGMRVLRPQDLDLLSQTQLRDDRLVRRSRWKTTKPAERYVYDLEVEGNHNYFANGTLVSNCSAYKNPSTQTYQVVRHLGHPERAARHWGLTATLIKNNLIEGFGIYSLLVPGLFPSSKNRFMNEYCLTRLQPIPNSRRQIPVIVGYRPDQIARFREKIDPYFLSRAKFDVAKELPVLTMREHKVGMTREQEDKYREALSGLLEIDKTGEEKEMTKLTALTYCQEIVDHPELVDCEGDSEKMDALFTMLTEGDFADEKVIVFSRFRKMVDKLEAVAKSKRYGLSTVRVTGKEEEDERQEAMRRFQDPNDAARICWITTAAKEGVNLQAAKVLIFYDSPWSAGDFLQVLGRMIRIGSLHDRCYAVHLVARGTIDVHVMAVLRKKMKLIEQVMGRRLKGDDMSDVVVASQDSIDDLFAAMSRDARRAV